MCQLVFGLGMNDMGMRVLRIVFDLQPHSLFTSECLPTNTAVKTHIHNMKRRGEQFVGDIHSGWVDYVDPIMDCDPTGKFVALKSDDLEPFYEVNCLYFSDKYPDNFRIFPMHDALYEYGVQQEMLEWIGYTKWQHFVDLNDGFRYIGKQPVTLKNFAVSGVCPCAWCDNLADFELVDKVSRAFALVCKDCAEKRDLGHFSNWVREEVIYDTS